MLTFCLLSSNGLSGAARGAKSIVNRMGRGIAGVGRAGVDSVARNESKKNKLFIGLFFNNSVLDPLKLIALLPGWFFALSAQFW